MKSESNRQEVRRTKGGEKLVDRNWSSETQMSSSDWSGGKSDVVGVQRRDEYSNTPPHR